MRKMFSVALVLGFMTASAFAVDPATKKPAPAAPAAPAPAANDTSAPAKDAAKPADTTKATDKKAAEPAKDKKAAEPAKEPAGAKPGSAKSGPAKSGQVCLITDYLKGTAEQIGE